MTAAVQLAGPTCHEYGIKGFGSTLSKVVMIGIAPGRDEVNSGKPFTGKSGQLLDKILESISLKREDMYATNLVCWHNDLPDVDQIKACWNRLTDEISEIKPKLIILLGGLVTETFLGRPLSKARGAVLWSDVYNCYILSTYHPAAILRGIGQKTGSSKDDRAAQYIYDFVRDLRKIPDILEWPVGAPNRNVEFTVATSNEHAQSMLDRINMAGQLGSYPCALDVETHSKYIDEVDVYGDGLACLAIATPDDTFVFTSDVCKDLLWPTSNGIKWIFHNGMYDVQVLRKYLGVQLEVAEDTMLQSYSVDERGGIHSLKTLAREFLGVDFWEENRYNDLHGYNARDARYTLMLWEFFYAWQVRDSVRSMYETILIPLLNVLVDTQYEGIKVDIKKHTRFAVYWGQAYLNLEETLQGIARDEGWPDHEKTGDGINLASPKQISKLLYTIFSLPGGPSTNMEQLELLRNQHPFIEPFMRFRHMARIYDTYITGLPEHIKEDGSLHSTVFIHGTATGRLSYRKPALQTIPVNYDRDDVDTELARVKEVFVPDSPNASGYEYEFLDVDFGKCELWNAYGYSKDPTLYEDLMSADYHTLVASNVFRKPYDEVTKQDRLKMKHVTFGVMYGREAQALSKDIKTSALDAQLYINAFFRRYPLYTEWYNDIKRTIRRDGEIVSATGRKRRLIILGSDVRVMKQAVNCPIQSTAGDMTQISMIRLHKPLKELGASIKVQVHDSLLIQMRKAEPYRTQTIQLVHDVMTSELIPGFPRVPIEMSAGRSWGTTKGFHDCHKLGCLKVK